MLPKYENVSPAAPAKYPVIPFGKSKFTLTGVVGRTLISDCTRTATGGMPGIAPGHTAFGQSCFQAGAPKLTSGVLMNFSSLSGILKPLLRNAMPKAFSFGGITWHVMQDVSYRRANIGKADN